MMYAWTAIFGAAALAGAWAQAGFDDLQSDAPPEDEIALLQRNDATRSDCGGTPCHKYYARTTILGHDGVMAMIQAGIKKATEINVPEDIVIVDTSGLVLGQIAMTGAKFLSQDCDVQSLDS